MASLLPQRIQWVTASPLWCTDSVEPARTRAPVLLHFESNRFMEELAARLEARPRPDLSELLVSQPRKLFQPAHGCFYLVAASLVCRQAGLPDRPVDVTREEQAAFVLRRLEAHGTECAWVPDPQDATRGRHHWTPLPEDGGQRLVEHEERFPLFPVIYSVEDRRRRLLAGLVPTSARDTFQPPGSPPEQPVEHSYVLRCVYVRPHCGALQPPVVSEPTVSFTLADFFDPEVKSRLPTGRSR